MFVHDLATTDHQVYLVEIHKFFLNLSAALHLSYLLEIGSLLHHNRVKVRLSNCKGSYCTFHPDCHCLHTD